jgi:hypothetical protein
MTAKPQAICAKCYQLFDAEGFTEHQKKKCFPLMLKPMKITMVTTVPLNVIAHMLERMSIPVLTATTDYPDIAYEEPSPSPISSPISKKGFMKFKQKYKLEEVSEIESESDTETEEVDLKAPIYPDKKKQENNPSLNYLNYDDCKEKNDAIVSDFLTAEGINDKMPSKLLSYILTVSKMKPINAQKVIKLSQAEYDVEVSDKATAPSVFVNIVIDNILKLNKAETKVALSLCAILGTKFYDVVKSKDIFYTKIRKPILQKYGKDSEQYTQSLDLMKITKEERTKLTIDYKKKVKDANKERKTYYSEDLIGIIEETKDVEDWATKAIGLMLSSGTRPIELLDKNTFKIDPSKGNNYVIVSGIAKKRDNKKDFTTTRPIIGYTSLEFIKAVDDFRNSISDRQLYITEGSDEGQLKKSNVALISSRLNKYFPKDPEITPKTLRKLYGNLAHALYGGTSNLNIYLGEILAHDENDIQTSFSYSTVMVIIGNKTSNSDNSNKSSPELEKKNEMLEPCRPNPKNLTDEKKKQIVKETIEKMVKDGLKLSQDKIICQSGVSWRIVRPTYNEYLKNGDEISV